MEQYIDKSALVAEIKNRRDSFYSLSKSCEKGTPAKAGFYAQAQTLEGILSFLDTLETNTFEVKEFQKKKLYVVTRCEEHSDYVEKAFFSEKKAEEYCKQFEGNEDAYGRDFTEIEVDCPLEEKEVVLERELKTLDNTLFDLDGVAVQGATHYLTVEDVKDIAKHFYELGQVKGE